NRGRRHRRSVDAGRSGLRSFVATSWLRGSTGRGRSGSRTGRLRSRGRSGGHASRGGSATRRSSSSTGRSSSRTAVAAGVAAIAGGFAALDLDALHLAAVGRAAAALATATAGAEHPVQQFKTEALATRSQAEHDRAENNVPLHRKTSP